MMALCRFLPGGSFVYADGRIQQQIYWKPQIRAGIVPSKPCEAFEALQSLLFRAVEDRISGSRGVASLLSGGLDSSAVCAIAAQCLQKKNRDITAISAIVEEENRLRFADERQYVEEFRSWQNLRVQYVTAPGMGPFDLIHEPLNYEDTFLWGSRLYLYYAMRAKAEIWCRCHIGGRGRGIRRVVYWERVPDRDACGNAAARCVWRPGRNSRGYGLPALRKPSGPGCAVRAPSKSVVPPSGASGARIHGNG